MPNHLSLSPNSQAASFYSSLDADALASLDEALDYIRDAPFAHGDTVRRQYMPPVYVYVYRDNQWRISYSLGALPRYATYDISVHAIARL